MTTYLARITYNTCNWRHPSGSKAKKETDTFVTNNGFGYEEWLLRDEWLVDGMRYAFVQGAHACRQRLIRENEPFNLVLFTIEPPEKNGAKKKRRFVAVIKNVSFVNEAENLKAKKYFTEKSWYDEMVTEINAVGGESQVFKNAKPCEAPFNIKFNPKDVKTLQCEKYFPEEISRRRFNRYQLFKRDPNDPDHQAIFESIKKLMKE